MHQLEAGVTPFRKKRWAKTISYTVTDVVFGFIYMMLEANGNVSEVFRRLLTIVHIQYMFLP
jgi:hypothetical protein